MARIRVRDVAEMRWWGRVSDGEIGDDERFEADNYAPVDDDFAGRTHRIHHPGSETDLQMFEVRMHPGDAFESHAHLTDEVIFVREGELHFGARVLREGSSVYVPANTLYAFRAGPTGLHFVNFRAVKDESFITKQQFLERRRGSAATAEGDVDEG